MTIALIMAGGQSSRMRASGNQCHKALRKVGGHSLIDHNIAQILAAGIREIYIAVSAGEESLLEYINHRGHLIVVDRAGGKIERLVEEQPLGTIGIAQRLAAHGKNVLVQNVDNLTSLDFKSMVDEHRVNDAAMTIATHVQDFPIPLGEVILDGKHIVEYREKPNHPVRISSGAYVLASRTCGMIPAGQRTDIPQLIPMLQQKQDTVLGFPHESPWIDVNDGDALQRAEALFQTHRTEFAGEFLDSPETESMQRCQEETAP